MLLGSHYQKMLIIITVPDKLLLFSTKTFSYFSIKSYDIQAHQNMDKININIFRWKQETTYINTEKAGHSMKVVLISGHL